MKYSKGNYFIVPNRKQLSGLSPQTQVVFMWLCARADDDGKCFPSYTNIAKTGGCSRSTVIRKIAELEDLGFIKKTKGDFKTSNKYQIMILPSVRDTLPSVTGTPPSVRGTLGVVSEVHSNNNHITITKNNRELEKLRKDLKEKKVIY